MGKDKKTLSAVPRSDGIHDIVSSRIGFGRTNVCSSSHRLSTDVNNIKSSGGVHHPIFCRIFSETDASSLKNSLEHMPLLTSASKLSRPDSDNAVKSLRHFSLLEETDFRICKRARVRQTCKFLG